MKGNRGSEEACSFRLFVVDVWNYVCTYTIKLYRIMTTDREMKNLYDRMTFSHHYHRYKYV